MTTADDTAARQRFARDRREAERRYNDALTALDHAVTAALEHPAPTRDDVARATTALIVYLQQITAFVESKDRATAADSDARFENIERAIDAIQELRVQLGTLRRRVEAVERTPAKPELWATSTEHRAALAQPRATRHDATYVAFEDEFRGSPDAIAARLSAYVPIFSGTDNVIDIGCGRGEFLGALKAAGIPARGVDANADMAAIARERGLDAVQGDALTFLESLPDGTAGGLIATQVIEHLEPGYLIQLLQTASRKLKPGAPALIETINVACWLAFFSSYLRDFSHVRPVHPETLQFLLRANGFERVEIRYSAPVSDPMRMKTVDLPAAITSSPEPLQAALSAVAHAVSVNAVILNSLMFTSMDYAAIGYRS
jgi:SAM-dependent methyltransferase